MGIFTSSSIIKAVSGLALFILHYIFPSNASLRMFYIKYIAILFSLYSFTRLHTNTYVFSIDAVNLVALVFIKNVIYLKGNVSNFYKSVCKMHIFMTTIHAREVIISFSKSIPAIRGCIVHYS